MSSQTNFDITKIINILFIVITIGICSLLIQFDIPGVGLLETNPNWLLIWVVAWSLRRTVWQGAIAGLAIGWIYDGITASSPSHVASFMIVGALSARLQKHKYIGEDFITVALIVFFMTILTETIFAWQYAREYGFSLGEVYQKFQRFFIVSGIITSLWSPAFYYPFSQCRNQIRLWQKQICKSP